MSRLGSLTTLFPAAAVATAALEPDLFLSRVGQTFVFRPAACWSQPASLRLAALWRGSAPGEPGAREPFSLLFTGEAGLKAGLYSLEQADFTSEDLFITQVQAPPDEPAAGYYEIVFG